MKKPNYGLWHAIMVSINAFKYFLVSFPKKNTILYNEKRVSNILNVLLEHTKVCFMWFCFPKV